MQSDGANAVPVTTVRDVSRLKNRRAIHKRTITIILNKLKELHQNNTLTATFVKKQIAVIDTELRTIKDFDVLIIDSMTESGAANTDTELDAQAEYHLNISLSLDQFEPFLISNPETPVKFADILSKIDNSEGKPPPLQCGTFSGEEKDKFAFYNFLTQFKNVIGSRANLTNSAKLSYLIGYLQGYALKVVNHLLINNVNYEIALKLLEEEFLDIDYIVDQTYKNVLSARPKFKSETEFIYIKEYINEIRSYLYELKNEGLDFLQDDTPGNSLMSHIVFNKLPNNFKRELITRVKKNYPSLQDIFDNYLDIIRILDIMSRTNKDFKKFESTKAVKSYKDKTNEASTSKSLHNFKTQSVRPKEFNKHPSRLCKLCSATDHSMGACNFFSTYEDRIRKLRGLSLCVYCAGAHDSEICYGKAGKLKQACKFCQSRNHISPLCPNNSNRTKEVSNNHLCLGHRTSDPFYLLPTMTLELTYNKSRLKVRCLIDTGSQRSYISARAASKLCHDMDRFYELDYEIHTYIGNGSKRLKQFLLGVNIEGTVINMPVLVDDSLKLQYEVPGMNDAVQNLKYNFMLADESFYTQRDHSLFDLDFLLGVDFFQFASNISVSPYMNGNLLMYNDRAIPFGNVRNFMVKQQISKLITEFKEPLSETEIKLTKQEETLVNFVLDPCKSYFNPLDSILTDSEVENGLENLFKFESLGIKSDDSEMIDFDKELIKKFEDGISYKDGHYFIDLPWYQDKVNLVPSNHNIALKVLSRVTSQLQKSGLISKYEEVFDKQLENDIIEEIEVSPKDYDKYVWLPHRPIVKTEEQVTTKIRPVFNCSLKIDKELPSLNEAAYPGLDMMSSLLKLMLNFRTNKYVLISDIKQAFLMIRLKSEFDKNKFCFFLEER